MPNRQPDPTGQPGLACREFLENHSDYLDGLMSRERLRAFDGHLGSCRSCSQYDRIVRRGLMLARNLPEVQPSAHFHEQLHARLMGMEDEPGRRPVVAGTATVVVIAAVLAVIAITPVLRLSEQAEPAPVTVTPTFEFTPIGIAPATSGTVLANTFQSAFYSPVIVQPPAMQPTPSAPRLIAYPLLQADER